jgi:serine/threonine protein kinase
MPYIATRGYIAPELYENQPYRCEPDMFSFGVVLFRMLFGEKPFPGKNEQRLRLNTVRLKYTIHEDRWALVTDPAKHLIRKLLIGRDDRLSADDASKHYWFQTCQGHADPIFQTTEIFGDLPSDAVALSQAPEYPSMGQDGKFWIDASIRGALDRLIETGGYIGRIETVPDESVDIGLICVEERLPKGAVLLPNYIAALECFSEYEARFLFSKIVHLIQIVHDEKVVHRNLHVENLLVEVSVRVLAVLASFDSFILIFFSSGRSRTVPRVSPMSSWLCEASNTQKCFVQIAR